MGTTRRCIALRGRPPDMSRIVQLVQSDLLWAKPSASHAVICVGMVLEAAHR
jgi:hypothetical protein